MSDNTRRNVFRGAIYGVKSAIIFLLIGLTYYLAVVIISPVMNYDEILSLFRPSKNIIPLVLFLIFHITVLIVGGIMTISNEPSNEIIIPLLICLTLYITAFIVGGIIVGICWENKHGAISAIIIAFISSYAAWVVMGTGVLIGMPGYIQTDLNIRNLMIILCAPLIYSIALAYAIHRHKEKRA